MRTLTPDHDTIGLIVLVALVAAGIVAAVLRRGA